MAKTSTTKRPALTAREAMTANAAIRGFKPAVMRSVAALAVLDAWQEEDGESYGYFALHQHDGAIDEVPHQDLHYLVPRQGTEYRPEALITERSSRSLKDSPSAPIAPYRKNRAPNWVRRYCYRFPPKLGGWIIMAKSNVTLVASVFSVYEEMAKAAPGLAARDKKALLIEIAGRIASKTEGVTIQPPTQQN